MIRKIITIDEEKCNGCGLCASACKEGAIAMVDGKAKLIRDDYCDGLGNCLPACPTGAISFEEREAAAFDEEAVKRHMENLERAKAETAKEASACGCPGTAPRILGGGKTAESGHGGCPGAASRALGGAGSEDGLSACHGHSPRAAVSQLRQWPVQIQLAPLGAPYFQGADLLIAADCTAYAYGDFHNRFIRDHVVLVGCPKLDPVDYSEKLTELFRRNEIRTVTVARMEVPCCGGLERAVRTALERSGKSLPLEVVTISVEGDILS